MTLDEALALLAQPKQRGRRAAAAPPLRELGADPVSGKPMVVKDGRFGPYVTDGETNASLRSADDVETLTDERAAELLAAAASAARRSRAREQSRTPAAPTRRDGRLRRILRVDKARVASIVRYLGGTTRAAAYGDCVREARRLGRRT